MNTSINGQSKLITVGMAFCILGSAMLSHANYATVVKGTPGLQHYWQLDEPGTPVQSLDEVGGKIATHVNGYPTNSVGGGAVSVAGPRPSDGFPGMAVGNNALRYNIPGKTRSFIDMPDKVGDKSFAYGDMTGLSLEFWFKRASTNTEAVIAGYLNNVNPRYGYLAAIVRRVDPIRWDFRVYNKDTVTKQTVYSCDGTSDTQWHHVVMAWDSKNLRTYLDGRETAESINNSEGPAFGALQPSEQLVFGGDASGQDFRYFDGALDHVAIYDRALTAGQAAQHYAAAVSSAPAQSPVEKSILALNPCHYWRMEETYGRSALDSVGNWTLNVVGAQLELGSEGVRPPAYPGFATNNYAASFVRSNWNYMQVHNANTDYLTPTNSFSGGTVTALTMSVWFRLSEDGPDNARQIIAGFQKSVGNRYMFLVNRESNGTLMFFVTDNSGDSQIIKAPYANITDSNWHNFVMTWDGSEVHTYLDGGNEKIYSDPNVAGALRASDGFFIGKDINNTNFFDGKVDDVALFNYTLSAAQVADLYKAAVRGKIPKGTCILVACADSDAPAKEMPSRGICAHRGAMATHPENTLAAFHEAVRLGAHMIEFDINLTKDERIVLMHDLSVDRTTDGRGKVTDLTFEQIRSLDAGSWKALQFAGERVPTFEETLAMMPMNIWLNVHTKSGAKLAVMAAQEIERQGRTHQAFLATGRDEATAARQVVPDILICNMENQGYSAAYVSDTIGHGDSFIQLLGQVASPEDMGRLKAADIRINLFMSNQPGTSEALATMFSAGIDFPLFDNPGPMVEAARLQGIEPLLPRMSIN